MVYNYPSHYLYDFLAVSMLLVLAKQLYNISLDKKQIASFIIWMMLFYQINFYIIIPNFQREYKYAVLYIGLFLGFHFIIRLNSVVSVIIIMTTTSLNGIFTNLNLLFMLQFVFPNYGVALEAQHFQYSCYIISIVILSMLTRVFRLRICDLQRYS
jgi:CDP-diglyceride synthetase